MKKQLRSFFLFLIPAMLLALAAYAHPFYVSISTVELNSKTKQVEVSCRMFSDDLETALKRSSTKHINLIKPANKQEADTAIARYVRQNFRVKLDGKGQSLKYVGYEIDEDVTWCYFVIEHIQQVKQVEIINQLLYQDFKSQSNIMHVQIGEHRKSSKLDNPKRIASFSF